jgi:prenylcysteine alpha-carboxyl methylesterase
MTATPAPTQKKTKTIRFSTPIKGQPVQGTPLDLDKIALVVLVSGPYDLFSMKTHLHTRGLDSSILTWICRGNLAKYSPTRRIARHVASSGDRFCYLHFPRTALFHGSDDATVPLPICEDLAEALLSGGGRVEVNVYPGLSHTDPILEGPLRGDETLMLDIVARVRDAVGADLAGRMSGEGKGGGSAWVHPVLVAIAKRLNPF